ncbi:MAG: zinc ribbon domain-containing protein [Coriobacteriia bacterium]|nr:zinc ribbon domain-containing protein [Coriobacteriia bacterium]
MTEQLNTTEAVEEPATTSQFCPECGARLPEGAKVCKFCNTVQEQNIHTLGDRAEVGNFLFNWRYDLVFCIIGVVASMCLQAVTRVLPDPFGMILSIVMMGALLYYSLLIYPTLFGSAAKITSNKAVSFCNFFLGGIIFGLLWNHNLTRKERGISYMIAAALACVNLASVALVSFGILR